MRASILAVLLVAGFALPVAAATHPVKGAVHGTATAGRGVVTGAGHAGRGIARGTVMAARGVGRGNGLPLHAGHPLPLVQLIG